MSELIQTRAEFQGLAGKRLVEAKALLYLGMWDGAYYLAGYAVELALKACIIKTLMTTDAFPPYRDFSKDCYTHDVDVLVKLAGLDDSRKTATAADPELRNNWVLARDWSEVKRYHRIDETEAKTLYSAISGDLHGVLPWIKSQW